MGLAANSSQGISETASPAGYACKVSNAFNFQSKQKSFVVKTIENSAVGERLKQDWLEDIQKWIAHSKDMQGVAQGAKLHQRGHKIKQANLVHYVGQISHSGSDGTIVGHADRLRAASVRRGVFFSGTLMKRHEFVFVINAFLST